MTIIKNKHINGELYLVVMYKVKDEVMYGTLNSKYVNENKEVIRDIYVLDLKGAETIEKAIELRVNEGAFLNKIRDKILKDYNNETNIERKKVIKEVLDGFKE